MEVYKRSSFKGKYPANAEMGQQGGTWGTFWLAPTHKAPLCVNSGLLTGFDRPVLTCPSGSNVFEIESYGGILFLHRPRSCCRFPRCNRSPFMLHS